MSGYEAFEKQTGVAGNATMVGGRRRRRKTRKSRKGRKSTKTARRR